MLPPWAASAITQLAHGVSAWLSRAPAAPPCPLCPDCRCVCPAAPQCPACPGAPSPCPESGAPSTRGEAPAPTVAAAWLTTVTALVVGIGLSEVSRLEGVNQVAYVLYAVPGPALWHQRWLMGRVVSCPSDAILVSPDRVVQWEVVDGSSADISAVRWAAGMGPRPPGVTRTYRFGAAPGPADVASWLPEAEAEPFPWAAPAGLAAPLPAAGGPAAAGAAGAGGAAGPLVAAGAPPPLAAAAAPHPAPLAGGVLGRGVGAAAAAAGAAALGGAGGGPPAGAALAAAVGGPPRPLLLAGGAGGAPAGPVGNWRAAHEWRGYHYGDVADGEEGDFGDRAVAPDCRLLPIRLDRAGKLCGALANIVESCREEALPEFIRRRTTMWCLEHLANEGRSLESHLEHFK
ncbi:unnamed protein product [Prorocentrum cordatum]|uniref:Uncharacterized protein n=1 Tax=Prorocentrum cordatum TaxID=2364126 RepID=A0ABN9V678_9DINO|nr:unnamed protein product [Polarella glacialis]